MTWTNMQEDLSLGFSLTILYQCRYRLVSVCIQYEKTHQFVLYAKPKVHLGLMPAAKCRTAGWPLPFTAAHHKISLPVT